MTGATGPLLALALAATIDVPAGGDLAAAVARARAGDVLRLGAGEHRGALGRLAGVRLEGAGAGETRILAPEGEDGAIAVGPLELAGLSLHAGPHRCGLKVLQGGDVRLSAVALSGGSCGAFASGGRIEARDVDLGGDYGLLSTRSEVALEGGSARGRRAGLAATGGTLSVRRFAIVGPASEGGLVVSGGARATLEAVVVRRPGPSGISVSEGARVEGTSVTVAGATEEGGVLGACAQSLRGELRLSASMLAGCAGAAVEASGGEVALSGVDAAGGEAGCIALVNGARADLSGNLCVGRGPGLVAASGARAKARVNRWWTDPVLWVDCGSGARVELGRGERGKSPCAGR